MKLSSNDATCLTELEHFLEAAAAAAAAVPLSKSSSCDLSEISF
jgi:hypothetical protein